MTHDQPTRSRGSNWQPYVDCTEALIDEADMFVVIKECVSRGLYPEHPWGPDIDRAQDTKAMLQAVLS